MIQTLITIPKKKKKIKLKHSWVAKYFENSSVFNACTKKLKISLVVESVVISSTHMGMCRDCSHFSLNDWMVCIWKALCTAELKFGWEVKNMLQEM